jgi:hypothetical protein
LQFSPDDGGDIFPEPSVDFTGVPVDIILNPECLFLKTDEEF